MVANASQRMIVQHSFLNQNSGNPAVYTSDTLSLEKETKIEIKYFLIILKFLFYNNDLIIPESQVKENKYEEV